MNNYHKAGKLADCSELGNDSDSELFIVEGDSAAKALLRVRSPRWQAVLPMQGKPMNATKHGEYAVENNVQFAALISALGTQIGDEFDISKIRYQRIILLFDPDADGIHGRTLLLLFFHKWMKPLLDNGRVYDARVPRWRIDSEKCESPQFASTDEQFNQLKRQLESAGVDDLRATRFRGIGSVGGETLLRCCIDPETRELGRLRSENAEAAIRMFEQLRSIMNPER